MKDDLKECIRINEEYTENRRPQTLEDINLEDLASARIRVALWIRGMRQMGCVRKQRHSIQIWTQNLRAGPHWAFDSGCYGGLDLRDC